MNEINAADARKLATSRKNTVVLSKLQTIYSDIRKAAEQGRTLISLKDFTNWSEVDKSAKKILEEQGFTFKYYDGYQRDPSYWTLSW